MNLFDGNTKSANPAGDVFAIILGFIWKKPQITQMLAHARAARRTTWAGMCSRLELVALVRRCRLTPTCFASPAVLLMA